MEGGHKDPAAKNFRRALTSQTKKSRLLNLRPSGDCIAKRDIVHSVVGILLLKFLIVEESIGQATEQCHGNSLLYQVTLSEQLPLPR